MIAVIGGIKHGPSTDGKASLTRLLNEGSWRSAGKLEPLSCVFRPFLCRSLGLCVRNRRRHVCPEVEAPPGARAPRLLLLLQRDLQAFSAPCCATKSSTATETFVKCETARVFGVFRTPTSVINGSVMKPCISLDGHCRRSILLTMDLGQQGLLSRRLFTVHRLQHGLVSVTISRTRSAGREGDHALKRRVRAARHKFQNRAVGVSSFAQFAAIPHEVLRCTTSRSVGAAFFVRQFRVASRRARLSSAHKRRPSASRVGTDTKRGRRFEVRRRCKERPLCAHRRHSPTAWRNRQIASLKWASWPSSNVKENRKAGTRAGLTKAAIVAAAATLIESVGANGFSLRKLAKAHSRRRSATLSSAKTARRFDTWLVLSGALAAALAPISGPFVARSCSGRGCRRRSVHAARRPN